MDADVKGLCQRSEFRTASGPSLWDSGAYQELTTKVDARHVKARQLCHQCPLLEQCERMLSDFERRGEPIDGVVAGRYADVPGLRKERPMCLGCGVELISLAEQSEARPDHRKAKLARRRRKAHIGEGLCRTCYPKLSRQARKGVKVA